MNKNHIAVRLYLCFAMAITMVSAQVQGIKGETMSIACNVAGTLPRWTKDLSVIFTTEGNPMINPDYSTRFSYAADQKTLIVYPVQPSDAGTYGCLIGGISGTDVVVSVLTIILVSCLEEGIVVCVFFILTIVVYTVVITKCIHILIKEQKNIKGKLPFVLVILITAVVIFLAVSGWFIAMMATVDAFQEMTQYNCYVYIGLLAFEVFDFVLGVCLTTYLFYTFRETVATGGKGAGPLEAVEKGLCPTTDARKD